MPWNWVCIFCSPQMVRRTFITSLDQPAAIMHLKVLVHVCVYPKHAWRGETVPHEKRMHCHMCFKMCKLDLLYLRCLAWIFWTHCYKSLGSVQCKSTSLQLKTAKHCDFTLPSIANPTYVHLVLSCIVSLRKDVCFCCRSLVRTRWGMVASHVSTTNSLWKINNNICVHFPIHIFRIILSSVSSASFCIVEKALHSLYAFSEVHLGTRLLTRRM